MIRTLSRSALTLFASACMLDPVACESDDQCVELFGDASQCGDEGYCSAPAICTTDADCFGRVGFGSVCEVDTGACVDVVPHPRCEKTFPTDLWTNLDEHRDRIVIGSIQDRNDVVHTQRENAFEVGLFVIDEATGEDGTRFAGVFCDVFGGPDNPYDILDRPDAAIETAGWMMDHDIHALVGPSSSGDTQLVFTDLVAPRAPEAVLISPSAASPSLTALDPIPATDEDPGLLWRTAPLADEQGLLIANDLHSRSPAPATNVAIIREQGAFGEGLALPFVDRWTELGGGSEQFIFPDGNTTARAEQITLAGTRADEFQAVVFIAQTGDSTGFMEQATANPSYADTLLIYFPQTGANDSVFATAENNRLFDRVRAVQPKLPNDFVYQSFQDIYTQRFGLDPKKYSFTAHAYDAVWLAALGSIWSREQLGYIDGVGIARGIRQTVAGDNAIPFTQSSWATAVLNMSEGSRIDITGASGDLDYDLETEENRAPLEILEGTDAGVFVVVE